MPSDTPLDIGKLRIGLVGYGEVGRILAEDLRARGLAVAACDTKLADASAAAPLHEHADRHGVTLVASHTLLAAHADLVICAVTADQTRAAADACTTGLRREAFFLDLNSASPKAKRDAAAAIEVAGGRYVEAAVMTSVPPYRIKVPMLLGGPHAAALAPALDALGFAARPQSGELGVVSATKMCRSVMIKGLEALVIESFTAARAYGVEAAVLASLAETFPGIDWERQGAYFFQRVIEHGRRRSEEMFESAATVREAGLKSFMAQAIAECQASVADTAEAGVFGRRGEKGFARNPDWRIEADRILASRPARNDEETR
jgi:3-hydroxyisobutyrate dehydrogenase-like beta-hydroxyacid dehydrogenase